MAIQNQPTNNPSFLEFARFWKPLRSTTTVWIEDVGKGRKINFVKWGDRIYVPVYEGMKLGIGLYNDSNDMMAYPTYIEASNLWSGGPAQPNECTPDYMWEMRAGETMVMDKVVNPFDQSGRPLVITRSGAGFTVGEATFGTQEFRGQIRVYERTRKWTQQQTYRPTNMGTTRSGATRSSGGLESFGGPTRSAGSKGLEGYEPPQTLGFPESTRSGSKSLEPETGKAGIGLGSEIYQNHVDTGVQYNKDAQPVIAMFIEFRSDLEAMLNQRFGYGAWDWYFDASGHGWWNNPSAGTAPQVPLAPRPHRPRS